MTKRLLYRLLERRLGEPITEPITERSSIRNVRVDLVKVMQDIHEIVLEDACAPHFLESAPLQNGLRRRVLNHLLRNINCDRDTATPLAEEIVDVVRARWADFCQ